MSDISVSATPEGDEFETCCRCRCCSLPIYFEGHQGRFTLVLARFDAEENLIPGVASIAGHIEGDAIHYSIIEPNETDWVDLKRFGPLLGREAALVNRVRFFELVDAIAANDLRISARIFASGLQA